MKAAVSLWSADFLEVGAALDRLTGVADAFHVDVMDRHFAPDLLFGPEFVRAVRKRTRGAVDVHLIVSEADRWVKPFAEAGADVLTVYPQSCLDVRGTLEEIRRLGVSAGVSVDLGYPLERVRDAVLELADRVVFMGTETGVKGVGLEPEALERVREVVRWRGIGGSPEIYVNGGIRRRTVPEIARVGADGVVPGSLVFGSESWEEAVHWVQDQEDQIVEKALLLKRHSILR